MFLYFLDFSQILHATIATYILTPRIRYSSYSCCSVTEKTDVMVLAPVMVLAYVMVKQARSAKRVAKGHQLEIGAQRAPRFLVYV